MKDKSEGAKIVATIYPEPEACLPSFHYVDIIKRRGSQYHLFGMNMVRGYMDLHDSYSTFEAALLKARVLIASEYWI